MDFAFLVPGALAQITGGYLYARQVVDGLRARGIAITLFELPGRYPDADTTARQAAAAALAGLPDGSVAVIDGLALPAFADCLAPEALRLCVVGFIHHPLSLETGLSPDRARHFAELEAALWPQLRGALCPSPHSARALIAAGMDAGRVAVAVPGTPPAGRRPPARTDGPLRILTVGTLTPRKGHALLVEALARLRSHDWQLDCIGSLERAPATTAALRALIDRHQLGARITLHGEQPPGHLAEAYRQADLFALPSWHEGYGMVLAEALAHGLPIVATTAGAIPDTVPAAAALLVPPGDGEALHDALQRLLTDTALRERLARAAAEAGASLPDWPTAVTRWAAALAQVAA